MKRKGRSPRGNENTNNETQEEHKTHKEIEQKKRKRRTHTHTENRKGRNPHGNENTNINQGEISTAEDHPQHGKTGTVPTTKARTLNKENTSGAEYKTAGTLAETKPQAMNQEENREQKTTPENTEQERNKGSEPMRSQLAIPFRMDPSPSEVDSSWTSASDRSSGHRFSGICFDSGGRFEPSPLGQQSGRTVFCLGFFSFFHCSCFCFRKGSFLSVSLFVCRFFQGDLLLEIFSLFEVF